MSHHPNCYQTRGVPQSLLDEGLPADLCDCKILWMIAGAEVEQRTQRITEWGIRLANGHVMPVNTVPVSDEVRDSQIKALSASGIVGELVARVRTHIPDEVSEWGQTEPAPAQVKNGPTTDLSQPWKTW